jgi:2-polyprenyl-3-methyl-5-hydroxy-6-metoxy-1,4-benzoquinol methylase
MSLFDEIERHVNSEKQSIEFKESFSTYMSEAEWGWHLIKDYVIELHKPATILELGAGPKILSAFIAKLGHEVSALEPASPGFSVMKELGHSVEEFALKKSIEFKSIQDTGENFNQVNTFDFAFSINVMEHVTSVEKTLDNVVSSLKVGGTYFFVCPNYSFPFEPHFSSPTLINKRLTDLYMRDRAIRKSSDPKNSADVWNSLNWITARQVKAWANNRDDIKVYISRRSLKMYLNRSTGSKEFNSRHPIISRLSKLLTPIATLIPITFIPVLEVMIKKTADAKTGGIA